jgi:hypothetical protein
VTLEAANNKNILNNQKTLIDPKWLGGSGLVLPRTLRVKCQTKIHQCILYIIMLTHNFFFDNIVYKEKCRKKK